MHLLDNGVENKDFIGEQLRQHFRFVLFEKGWSDLKFIDFQVLYCHSRLHSALYIEQLNVKLNSIPFFITINATLVLFLPITVIVPLSAPRLFPYLSIFLYSIYLSSFTPKPPRRT